MDGCSFSSALVQDRFVGYKNFETQSWLEVVNCTLQLRIRSAWLTLLLSAVTVLDIRLTRRGLFVFHQPLNAHSSVRSVMLTSTVWQGMQWNQRRRSTTVTMILLSLMLFSAVALSDEAGSFLCLFVFLSPLPPYHCLLLYLRVFVQCITTALRIEWIGSL